MKIEELNTIRNSYERIKEDQIKAKKNPLFQTRHILEKYKLSFYLKPQKSNTQYIPPIPIGQKQIEKHIFH